LKLQRAIGQTSQILLLFVQDASVSTGAGLANVVGSNVAYTWFHNSQALVSTGTASTAGTTGTYSTSAWTQVSSSQALGWYSFGAPDGVFAIGDCVGIHFYNAPNMVPLPVEIELVRDNPQQFSSSKVFLAHTSTSPANVVQIQGQNAVTTGSGILSVSTQALTYQVNVTSWANSTVAATSSGIVDVNLVNIWNKSAVTSASGILTVSTQSLVGIVVSTQALTYNVNVTSWANSTVAATSSGIVDVNLVNIWNKSAVTSASGTLNVSTQLMNFKVNVSSWANSTVVATSSGIVDVNLVNIWNKSAVTSGSGILTVSTQALAAAGSDIQTVWGQPIVTSAAGIFDVNLINVLNQPVVTSGAGILNVSTQTLAAGAGDIISVYGVPIVTSGAGIINVSTQKIDKGGYGVTTNADKGGYGVTTNADKTAYSLTAAERASIMDVINTTVVSEAYRSSSAAGTVTQLMYEVLANVTDMVNSGTSRTLNSVTSHTAITVQYQYDSTTPSAISRIA
jgi:hypothetical protein